MSGGTIGGIVGGIAGAFIGSFFGATALGWVIGSTLGGVAGAILDPTVQEAPRLNDVKLQRSQYGQPISFIWGVFRLAGHVDWIGNNGELVEHSEGGGGKGGGGQPARRTYTGSWSLIFNKSTRAGQEAIKAIDKIWGDGRVIPREELNPTVYTGWALQLPDSSMEADLGVGNAPAHRFIGSMVMNQVQMEPYFNRLPNIEVLARTVEVETGAIIQVASNDNTQWVGGTRPLVWKTQWATDGVLPDPASVQLNASNFNYLEDSVGAHRVYHIGEAYAPNGAVVDLYFDHTTPRQAIGGAPATVPGQTYGLPAFYWVQHFESGGEGGSGTAYNVYHDFAEEAGCEVGRYVTGVAFSPDRHIVIILTTPLNPDTNPTTIADTWHRIVDGVEETTGTRDPDQWAVKNFGLGNVGKIVQGTANSCENNGRWIWRYHTNIPPVTTSTDRDPTGVSLLHIEDNGAMVEYHVAELPNPDYYLSWGGPQRTGENGGCLVTEEGYFGTISGRINDAPSANGTQTALYTRISGPGLVTLEEILTDVTLMRDGLPQSRFDYSAAATTYVKGACMGARMQKRNFSAMLAQAYDYDIVESDNGTSGILKLVFRGGDSVVEIPDRHLGVHAEGEGPKPLLELVSELQEDELPAQINLQFYNAALDYNIDSVMSIVASPFVDNVTNIDLPLVLTVDEALAIANRILFRLRLEKGTYRIYTARAYAKYEPADVITVQGRDFRIEKKSETHNGVITWELKLSAPYIADQPVAGAPGQGHTPNPPASPRGATTAKFFDVAMVVDGDLDSGFYVAACPEVPGSTWTGYTLYKSADGGTTYNEIANSIVPTTMGTVVTPLPTFNGLMPFDYTNVLRVIMTNGTLENVTEEAALGGANAVIYGNEVMNFTTAELVSTGPDVYDVTGLLRGRRGTEWAMTSHQPNETFALHASCINVPITDEEVGQARLYKAVTSGGSLTNATAMSFTCNAASARCYTPVHLAGGIEGDGDLVLECYTRTRRGGSWRDFNNILQTDLPEEVVFELWDATYTLCAMVIAGITPTNSHATTTIAVADLITAFGAEQERYYFTAGQVGRYRLGLRAQGVVVGRGTSIDDPVDPEPPYNPPGEPGVGGGVVNVTLTPPDDVEHDAAFRIGDTWVAKFTTGAAISGNVSAANYSGSATGWRIRLCTDLAGTNVIGEAFGNPVASLSLGTAYAWSIPITASTDYYVYITAQLANLDPSGPTGTVIDVSVTLNLE